MPVASAKRTSYRGTTPLSLDYGGVDLAQEHFGAEISHTLWPPASTAVQHQVFRTSQDAGGGDCARHPLRFCRAQKGPKTPGGWLTRSRW
jgi:hypothetical protein